MRRNTSCDSSSPHRFVSPSCPQQKNINPGLRLTKPRRGHFFRMIVSVRRCRDLYDLTQESLGTFTVLFIT